MKFTLERGTLLKALAHVQSAVERRSSIPILANVLIDVGDGSLTLTATDMDLTVVDSVPVDMAEPGAITVPARTLHDIVRKFPDDVSVQIATIDDGAHVTVKAGRSRFRLATKPLSLHGGGQPCRVWNRRTVTWRARTEQFPEQPPDRPPRRKNSSTRHGTRKP